jgi:ribonuclease HI
MTAAADDVIALEYQLLTTACRADPTFVDRTLHPDFAEFGRSGQVWTREDTINALATDPSIAEQAEDVSAVELSDDVVLVTYRTVGALRSSIWVRHQGRWQMRFHQGTRTSTERAARDDGTR